MIIYYREVESGAGAWLEADYKDADRIRKQEDTHHLGMYALSRRPTDDDGTPLKYQGDLHLDIDNEDIDVSTHSAKLIVDLLKQYEVNEDALEIWASGGKGYHIRISGRHFGAYRAIENLPQFHKYMASVIAARADAVGVDLQRYGSGKSGTLRVANKLRSNGKYKVPITVEELYGMTVESYSEITSHPRDELKLAKPEESTELTLLYREAVKAFDRPKNAKPGITTERFKVMGDALPQCVEDAIACENIPKGDGAWNYAKMTLARYISVTDIDGDDLIDRMATNWDGESKRNPTVRSRVADVKAAARSMSAKTDFPCSIVSASFSMKPCRGCKLNEASEEKQAAEEFSRGNLMEGLVFEDTGVYAKESGKSSEVFTNFVLEPVSVYYDADKPDKISKLVVKLKVDQDTSAYTLDLPPLAFSGKAKFKAAVMGHGMANFFGGDNDPGFIYALITTPNKLEGIPRMTESNRVGIVRHKCSARGIDELTWVQKDWSLNYKGIEDTMSFKETVKRQGEDSHKLAMDLRCTTGTIDAQALSMFHSLILSRDDSASSSFLGFMAACWIKQFLQRPEYDNHFPVLQVYGPSGSGKSSLVRYWSGIAGADIVNGGVLALQQITPASLRSEAIVTTTVPRVIDECNPSKVAKAKWEGAREIIKSAASKMSVGVMTKLADGTMANLNIVCSSPLVTMGVARIAEKEIEERTEQVELFATHVALPKYQDEFRKILYDSTFLSKIAGAFMRESMVIDKDTITEWQEKNRAVAFSGGLDNRPASMASTILTGLDFAAHVVKARAECDSSAVLAKIVDLREAYIGRMSSVVAVRSTRSDEKTIFMVHLSEMAATYRDFRGDLIMKPGVHFQVTTTQLHLRPNAVYLIYSRFLREQGLIKEYASHAALAESLKTHESFVAQGIASDLPQPLDWLTFDLSILAAGGLDVTRFYRNAS
jgi:energy-coupling factor transporter ATP-binding protein EcfA2